MEEFRVKEFHFPTEFKKATLERNGTTIVIVYAECTCGKKICVNNIISKAMKAAQTGIEKTMDSGEDFNVWDILFDELEGEKYDGND